MPKTKNTQASGYEVVVDRVINPGRGTREGKITILVAAGSARLRLHLQLEDAARLVEGISAAVEQIRARTAAPR
jgi:hypothetical protein